MILFSIGIFISALVSLVMSWIHHERILKLYSDLECMKRLLKDSFAYKPILTIQEQIADELHLLTEENISYI